MNQAIPPLSGRPAKSPGALLLAALLLVALAPGLAGAAVFTWVDEHGVVHMTDKKVTDPGAKVKTLDASPSAPTPAASRAAAVRAELRAARNLPGYAELQRIAEEYRRTHTYSITDYFICVDMALEMANILKTRKFTARVVAGNNKVDTAGMDPAKCMETFDHAWVVVELAPKVNVAVETTGGFVVDENAPDFEYYYQGLVFNDPRQAKETDDLIRGIKDNCARANEMIKEWNASHAGRAVDPGGLEEKGRVDAKVADCTGDQQKYQELIKKQYRALY